MPALLTRAQMQAMDRLAIDQLGIPALVLMEVAGRAVADAVWALYRDDPLPVLALAGSGNNGGDAVVAARHLRERGVPVRLLVIGEPGALSPDLEVQLAIARGLGLDAAFASGTFAAEALVVESDGAGYAIDGLFGTGLSRPVAGEHLQVIEALNLSELRVVAVDVPSGLDADTGQVLGAAVVAEVTVTFQFAKIGLLLHPGRDFAGEIQVVDIGIPPSRLPAVGARVELLTDGVIGEALPPREPDAHKGTFGHLLVVAGIPDRPGAALLTGRAALRAGAGLVTIASDRETVARLAPAFDELMGRVVGVERLDPDQILEALERCHALAIGPSLLPDDHLKAVLRRVLTEARVPAVLDAGALAALGTDHGWLDERRAATILTPHPGEMGKLMGLDGKAVQSDRLAVAQRLAASSGAHVVLKGAATVIASPDGSAAVSARGNPGMATGGTGDVLTGVIGALLAQGVAPGLAARAGVQLHARAGDLAVEEVGEVGLVASDVLRFLARATAGGVEDGREGGSR